MEEIYYTYAYLDDNNKPYYVGKGSGNRAYAPHSNVEVPEDKSKILFLKKNLSEKKAFEHEAYMIHVLGRKHLGGLLENIHPGCKYNPQNRRAPSEISKILSKKRNKLIDALELISDKVKVEQFIDDLISQITHDFTRTPLEVFCNHYSISCYEKYKEDYDQYFNESFLGEFNDIQFIIGGKYNKSVMKNGPLDNEQFRNTLDFLLSSNTIWEEDGYYFRDVYVSDEERLELFNRFRNLANE
jgi:hypothetical protein